MEELVLILQEVATKLDDISVKLGNISEHIESIDAKLGTGAFGLDDIHSQLSLIDSTLGLIEVNTSS